MAELDQRCCGQAEAPRSQQSSINQGESCQDSGNGVDLQAQSVRLIKKTARSWLMPDSRR
jgi:hypothetical protein